MAKDKNALAIVDDVTKLPATLMARIEAAAGAGFENATVDDFQLPYLKRAESMSPAVNSKKPEYIKGLELGQIFDSVTGEVFPDGVDVIITAYMAHYVEWKPNRGGFVARHPISTPLKAQAVRDGSQDILPNGNVLNRTAYFYVLYRSAAGNWKPGVISMDRSQSKAAKIWYSNAADKLLPDGKGTVPLHAQIWHMDTVDVSGEKGDYSVFSPSFKGYVDNEDLFTKAETFGNQVQEGEIEAQTPAEEKVEGSIEATASEPQTVSEVTDF